MRGFRARERGQALVIVVFSFAVLLLMAGLAIDGGMVFLERRRMQNAADSSALAGTRVLAEAICSVGGANDPAIEAEVRKYAIENGVADPDSDLVAEYVGPQLQTLGAVGDGSIPVGSVGVRAHLASTKPTYFVRLLGIDSAGAAAPALAVTGVVVEYGGGAGPFLPIGVPLDVVEDLGPGDDFVVMENNDHDGGMFCVPDDDDPGEVNCIGDPSNSNAHRGWLNLNYIYNTEYTAMASAHYRTFERNAPNRGCGPDPDISIDDGLRGWASGECPYPFPVYAGAHHGTNGDFIHGDPGARQSSLMEISGFIDMEVIAPVFDYIYMSDYMDEHFEDPEGIGWPRAGGGGAAYLYHIIGFIPMRINNVSGHTLEAEFIKLIIGEGQINASSGGYGEPGACETELAYGVSLLQ
jgi:hypothetical protein